MSKQNYMEIVLEIFNKQTQDQVFGNILKFLFENIFKADFLRDLCFYRTTADPRAHYAAQLLSTLHNFREWMDMNVVSAFCIHTAHPFCSFFFALFVVFISQNASRAGKLAMSFTAFCLDCYCCYRGTISNITSAIMLSTHLTHDFFLSLLLCLGTTNKAHI